MNRRKAIAEVISILFVLLFVYAAVSKLADFQKFQVQLGKSPLLAPFVNFVIWVVPAVEISVAVLLAIKRYQLPALYLSFSLMVAFTAYIVTILNFSEYIPCTCGGILQNMNWHQHLLFNLAFVGLAAAGVLIYPIQEQRTISRIGGHAENLKKE